MSRFSAESLGLALCEEASRRERGGWAGLLESGILKVRIHGMPLDDIRPLMTAFIESIQRNGATVSLIEQQTGATPLPTIHAGEIPWGTVIRQKLTTRLLDLLPEGAYLVLNSYGSGGEGIFAERLGGADTREEVWRRAQLTGASNRLCRLVWTEVDSGVPVRGPEGHAVAALTTSELRLVGRHGRPSDLLAILRSKAGRIGSRL